MEAGKSTTEIKSVGYWIVKRNTTQISAALEVY